MRSGTYLHLCSWETFRALLCHFLPFLMALCPPPSRCVWCQNTVHDDCMDSLPDADQCELGEFHSLIIPPHYLYQVNKLRRRQPEEYSQVRDTGLRLWVRVGSWSCFKQLCVSCVFLQLASCCGSGWTPVLVLANTRSGNNMGEALLGEFRTVLNPVQVRLFLSQLDKTI